MTLIELKSAMFVASDIVAITREGCVLLVRIRTTDLWYSIKYETHKDACDAYYQAKLTLRDLPGP